MNPDNKSKTSPSQFKSLCLRFKHPWRPEQQRILDNLHQYDEDKRIHIVAAPGAGKTVIGLEIFNRLQLKTLAVSPTRVVRNQWLERLIDFLPRNTKRPSWCTTKLQSPQLFTATTYQAIFSFDKNLSDETIDKRYESLSHWFKAHDIRLLILDEAHHLKAAWWKVLMKIVNQSKDLIIISLTATPPYDASSLEWSRYQKLCGPVDEEISIPELVRSNSLCPHQDYIWMVRTDDKNITSLKKQQENLSNFLISLNENSELLYLLHLHEWLDPERSINQKDLLDNLDECFSLLALLKEQKNQLPKHLLSILEIDEVSIGPLNTFAWENLLQSLLDGIHYPSALPVQAFQEALARLLKGKYFLKYGRVSLDNSRKKLEAFNKTQERIKACFDITNVELNARQDWSRIVVLTDYIHDEKYHLKLDGLEAPTGAYPIFHYFVHHLDEMISSKIALLTGRLSIVHKNLLEKLLQYSPPLSSVSNKIYSENPNYLVFKISSELITSALTKLHRDGDVLILIGTRALLGEGWDAPHVNSLILATQTGAYVSSNQLRGRAIRIDLNDDFKTSSIWHIVAVAPQAEYNAFILKDLHRRFKTFAGIHAHELVIESGVDRLLLTDNATNQVNDNTALDIEKLSNDKTIERHQDDIYNLQARWQNALEKVDKHVFQTGLQIHISEDYKRSNIAQYVGLLEKKQTNEYLKFQRTTQLITTGLLASLSIAIPFALLRWVNITALLPNALGVVSPLFLAWYLRYKRKGTQFTPSVNADHLPMAFAQLTLKALQEINLIQTHDSLENDIEISEVEKNYFRFSLNDYTRKENEIFLTALSQLFEPIRQPRYLIALNKDPKAGDIFPVPHKLGSKKEYANIFLKNWLIALPEFEEVQLHATTGEKGRELLLKARAANYNEKDLEDIRLIERWE